MIIGAIIMQASLTDAPPTSAIGSAMSWVSELLFGPLATIIAVIAIACIGFAMLSGRIDIRRGLSVVLGCFLLFGAKGMVEGLRNTKIDDSGRVAARVPPPPSYSKLPPSMNNANGFDPYAGAAIQ